MLVLNVEGMSCQGCVRSVTNALTQLDPTAKVEVTLATGVVAVETAKTRDELAAAIEAAGFDVRPA